MNLTDIFFNIFIIVFLLFVNGFFVAAEFALVGVRKTRIQQLCNEGSFDAKLALNAVKNIDSYIAAVQLGITIASLGLGWVGEETIAVLISPLFNLLPNNFGSIATHTVSASIAFALITIFHVVIGELMPKSIALQYPEATTLFVAKPMFVITKIFSPFIFLLNGLGNFLLKICRIEPANNRSTVHTTEELDMLIDASCKGGAIKEQEAEMLHNMFKFSDLMAKQVMIPRTDMMCIQNDISYEELTRFTLENQYTRYPVYEENIDKILGFIHVKDLYSLSMSKENFSIEKLIRPLMLVPETMTLDNLIIEFKKSHGQMAVVIDEFGGTAGLITLEDVLEEIIGEVQDEFDEEEEADIKEIAENTYLANAMMRIDELVEFFDLNEAEFEEDDVETIAGLVVKLLGRIADVSDTVSFNGLTFTVVEVDGARVTKLQVYKEPIPESLTQTEEA